MTRRIAVLSVGVVLLLLFGVVGAAVPVPYVAQFPGPTYNTLGTIDGEQVIGVTGRERNDVRGNLNLTTVGVSKPGVSLVEAVQGWFDDEVSIVPEEIVYPPERSEQETQEINRTAFLDSEESAEAAALGTLGFPTKVVVRDLSEDSPSQGSLEESDALETVDGQSVPDTDALATVLTAIPAGTTVTVAYTRLGEPGTAQITTAAATDRDGSLLGLSVADLPSAPFDVDIQVAEVGGPSAGLMLTLGILDLVGDTDLTDGAVIAGTGTIDASGTVGPIGGIQLKMVAAHDIGATLFLVPADNCAEALEAPQPGLVLAKVASLDDALDALADRRAGRAPEGC